MPKLTQAQARAGFKKRPGQYKPETSQHAKPFCRTTAQKLADTLARAEVDRLESCGLQVGE